MGKSRLLFLLSFLSISLSGCGASNPFNVNDDLNHEHTFSTEWTSNASFHWHAATCGHDEIRDYAQHVFGDWHVEKAPTEEEAGVKYQLCTICNYKHSEPMDILGHVHDWDTPTYEWSDNYVSCTAKRVCKKDGTHVEEETKEAEISKDNYTLTLSTSFEGLAFESQNHQITVDEEENLAKLSFSLNDDGVSYSVSAANTDIAGYVIIPSTHNDLPVTTIGEEAFKSCESLVYLYVPSGVTYIGDHAFKDCTLLTFISLPNSLTHFSDNALYNCYSLRKKQYSYAWYLGNETNPYLILRNADHRWIDSCNIHGACKFIYSQAFYGCDYLRYIDIPNNVISIGSSAFNGCISLTRVDFGNNLKSIGEDAFIYCRKIGYLNLPDSLETIGYGAFQYCTSISHVILGTGLKSIGWAAFNGCNKLAEVINKSSLPILIGSKSNGDVALNARQVITSMDDSKLNTDTQGFVTYSDAGKKSLVGYTNSVLNVTIPNDVTDISDCAFVSGWGKSIISVDIPSSVTSIGNNAFDNCSRLETITIPHTIESIGEDAFSDCTALRYNEYNNGYYLGDDENPYVAFIKPTTYYESAFEINPNCKFIMNEAFKDCSSIVSIAIPDSVVSVGHDAFNGCTSLTSISLNNAHYIGEKAFYNCSSLESISISDSIDSIGHRAFEGCSSLSYNEFGNGKYLGNDVNQYLALVVVKDLTSSSFEINENCKLMCTSALVNYHALTSLYIPANVLYGAENATFNAKNLVSITVDPDNANYSSEDGLLYNKDQSKLFYCPDAYNGTLVIPNTVSSFKKLPFSECKSLTNIQFEAGTSITMLEDYAFAQCKSIETVTLPNSITLIGEYAFIGCKSLTSITIPHNVKVIDVGALSRCTSLESINYNGTMEEWKSISLGMQWNYDIPAAYVTCTDGSVAL